MKLNWMTIVVVLGCLGSAVAMVLSGHADAGLVSGLVTGLVGAMMPAAVEKAQ